MAPKKEKYVKSSDSEEDERKKKIAYKKNVFSN